MPLFGTPPRIRPYFGYRNTRRLKISGRALRAAEPDWSRSGTFGKLRTVFAHFASREVPGVVVTLEARCGQQTVTSTGTTDGEGYVHFDVDLGADWPLPDRTRWETVTLRWVARGTARDCEAYVLAPGAETRLAIVSDIDDTIVETGAHDLVRNWRRVLAQMPGERLPVPGAAEIFGRLGGAVAGDTLSASERPFFYVSSSPWNLFDYLFAFQKAHGLPHGPMFLRDWGFNRATLGRGSHGAHKAAAIGGLVEFYSDVRFALIGDSTQADATAYAEAVRAHPDRVAGVLIRKAPGAPVDPEEEAALNSIRDAGVPVWLGETYALDRAFIAALGLSGDAETGAVLATATAMPASASAPVQLPAG